MRYTLEKLQKLRDERDRVWKLLLRTKTPFYITRLNKVQQELDKVETKSTRTIRYEYKG